MRMKLAQHGRTLAKYGKQSKNTGEQLHNETELEEHFAGNLPMWPDIA